LKDSIEETLYFPRENGAFSLPEDKVLPFSTLTVEGRSLGQANARTTSVLSQPVSSGSAGSSHSATLILSSTAPYQGTSASMFRSVVARRPPPSHTLKIVKARIVKNGRRVQFIPNLFVRLVESTANVDSITTAAREEWGTGILIVTHDGLRIENSPATRGM